MSAAPADVRIGPRVGVRTWRLAGAIGAAIAFGEVASAAGLPVLGLATYGALLAALAVAYVRTGPSDSRPLMVALAMLCVFRLATLGSPFGSLPVAGRCIAVGLPTWVSIMLALRLPELRGGLGLRLPRDGQTSGHVLVALSGIPLGVVAFAALHPGAPSQQSATSFLMDVIGLVVFSAVLEEVLFRRLLLRALTQRFGRPGIVLAAALFGVVYAGTRSPAMVTLAIGIGALFGWWADRTDSVAAPAVAHSVINIVVFLAWAPLGLRVLG